MGAPANLVDAVHARGAWRWPQRFPSLLLVLFFAIWIALAIAPNHRADWILENVLVLIAVPTLIWSHRRVPLSNGSYLALFAFGVLHEIGAHYTYAEVPYDRWLEALFGPSPRGWFDIGRNHYDRAIHFAYGLLATPAAMQLLDARAPPKGWWRWLLPVAFITSHSVLYELIEWIAAIVFGADLRMAYLATQGDVWDAQKDMAQALAGSVVAVITVLAYRRRRRRASTPAMPG